MTACAAQNGTVLELRNVGDIQGTFWVPAYQRGYRWGTTEVEALLNDIRASAGAVYCLQPVVVLPRADGTWELIDGQQRLTTLFLIFSHLAASNPDASPTFRFDFGTRPKSALYMANPGRELTPEDDDIEVFHLDRAYRTIRDWFANEPRGTSTQLVLALCGWVKVIWYQVPAGTRPNELFRRLNGGRIALTNSELIKASILRGSVDSSDAEATPALARARQSQRQRQFVIASQWDAIEHDLNDPAFWAFITPTPGLAYPSRIELLFDLEAGKWDEENAKRDRFHTFLHFKRAIDGPGPKPRTDEAAEQASNAQWARIRRVHALLRDWYDDRDDLYHRIGFLVATGSDLRAMVQQAQSGCTKLAFGAYVTEQIRRRLGLTREAALGLSYDGGHTSQCTRLLLLFNIETVRHLRNSSERYPFAAHHSESWSLEHIHAQNAVPLNTEAQWRAWLVDHRKALAGLPPPNAAEAGGARDRRQALLEAIDAVKDRPSRGDYERLSPEIVAEFTAAGGDDVHALSNLALLSGGANSALSNSVFEVKRRKLFELDAKGVAVPICTRRVFLKQYTDTDDQQPHVWGPADRMAYLKAMLDPEVGLVTPYLTKEPSR